MMKIILLTIMITKNLLLLSFPCEKLVYMCILCSYISSNVIKLVDEFPFQEIFN